MDCAPYPAFRTPHTCPWGEPGAGVGASSWSRRGRAKVPPASGAALSSQGPVPRGPSSGSPLCPPHPAQCHPHLEPRLIAGPPPCTPPPSRLVPRPPRPQLRPRRSGPGQLIVLDPGSRGLGWRGLRAGAVACLLPTRLWATLANLDRGHRGSAVSWEVPGALGEPPYPAIPREGGLGRGQI